MRCLFWLAVSDNQEIHTVQLDPSMPSPLRPQQRGFEKPLRAKILCAITIVSPKLFGCDPEIFLEAVQ
jgi:hypothetical protein